MGQMDFVVKGLMIGGLCTGGCNRPEYGITGVKNVSSSAYDGVGLPKKILGLQPFERIREDGSA